MKTFFDTIKLILFLVGMAILAPFILLAHLTHGTSGGWYMKISETPGVINRTIYFILYPFFKIGFFALDIFFPLVEKLNKA